MGDKGYGPIKCIKFTNSDDKEVAAQVMYEYKIRTIRDEKLISLQIS